MDWVFGGESRKLIGSINKVLKESVATMGIRRTRWIRKSSANGTQVREEWVIFVIIFIDRRLARGSLSILNIKKEYKSRIRAK